MAIGLQLVRSLLAAQVTIAGRIVDETGGCGKRQPGRTKSRDPQ
jgi:hypothetical protein